ncbi:AMP-dependent synthetase/ligase [Actinomyces wuliandei]|uniref:AMP-dependent synthetase/ligase n=1 Tax=Actinomyces wuliandei TaxID=2057743 RepID=UPI000FD88DEE|nr:AMP-dependent synthetase/ligase [Actinomyces wuliandei]
MTHDDTTPTEGGHSPGGPVRELSTEPLVPAHPGMTCPWALAERVSRSPEGALVSRKTALGRGWQDMSAAAFRTHVREVAAGLVATGLQPGDAVGIMARTSYEWTLMDFAAWEAGLVVVPVYETASAEQVQWILTDSDVRLLLVEDRAMEAMVSSIRASHPHLARLTVLCAEREALPSLVAAGRSVEAAELDRRSAALTSDTLATVVYTSGTTGRPRGAELTHGNLVHLCVNACAHVPEVLGGPDVRILLFLPLAHVLGRFLEIAVVCSEAGVLGHAPDVRSLVPDLESFRPTAVLAVPRVFEKIYNAADARAAGTRQKVFRLAAKTAIAYSRALDTAGGPSRALRAQHAAFNRLVFTRLRSVLGGRVRYVVSGGGPLGERLGHFYRGVGVTVLEGYGLTETMGPCTVNLPGTTRIGTVGIPLPGCSVRLADDAEVLVRGIGTFRGYHDDPQATSQALAQDGWLATGDLGSIEEGGFLRITGRKKEIIVTAGGKNIAPSLLEDRLRGHPLVSQVLVVGDNRPCIGALICLDAEMLPQWLRSHGLEEMDVAQAARDIRVRSALERAVARANQAVSRAESIRTFAVLPTDFTVANGLLTPSLKVRREEAHRRFASEIDELYTRPLSA